MPLHIAIDASRTTVPNITGTERYALESIRALIQRNATLDEPHTLTLYFRDKPAPDLFPQSEHVQQQVLWPPRLWTQISLARAVARDKPDVTWVPAHTLPFLLRGKAVVTVHDIGYRVYPSAHPLRQRIPLEVYTRFSQRRADIVLADSIATARDLTRYYETPRDKIRVVYPGLTSPLVGDVDEVRRRYNIPERYWLHIGTLQPRKNIAALVGAYHQWKAANPEVPTALVLAGSKGWKFNPQWITGDGVIVTGYITEEEKGALLEGAFGLVFPSLYEGFGFPVLEAMSVGTPVICSDNASLPEVGGDVPLYAKANNVLMLSDHMNILTEEPDTRAAMSERGRAQAAKFTWDRTAQGVLAALEEAARG
ncbi:MAG: glycosyltransferase family 1 protein [Chloroflexota bacterium]